MSRALVTVALALSALACDPEALPPEGQVRLFVDTDALLPPAPGDVAVAPPLFDRLRIEVFPPGDVAPCDGCTREFGIEHRTVFEGRASVGLATPPGKKGYRARVRLYRGGGADVVDPRPTSTLEAVVHLPIVDAEGIVDAHVVLRTDDLGVPQGTLDAPIDALPGPAEGGLAGSWAAESRRGCAGAPGPGEVCVPGGAYWMGDPSFEIPSERLVVISPFYLDATEVTVGQLRASKHHGLSDVVQRSIEARCTYTAKPDAFEAHAVNCVTYAAAEAYCADQGKALPSEAAWEFAARALRSAQAVWGDDEPTCEDAVFGRDGASNRPELNACVALGAGVQPVGSGARDRLALDGGVIVDLMGNLGEWMRDAWAEEGEPCWSAPILQDPVCAAPTTIGPARLATRGAYWSAPRVYLRGAIRQGILAKEKSKATTWIGFRCARPSP